MNPRLLEILQHSLGADSCGQGQQYRNHFVTGPDGDDWPLLQELCAAEFMRDHGARETMGGMHLFAVTEAGKEAVAKFSPKPPPRKASRAFEAWGTYQEAFGRLPFSRFWSEVWPDYKRRGWA